MEIKPSRRRALQALTRHSRDRRSSTRSWARRSIRGRSTNTAARSGLNEMIDAFDFEPVAFANVPLATYDYTAHGDGSEFTLRRNREAFDWVDVVPSASPVDAARVDLQSTLLGIP